MENNYLLNRFKEYLKIKGNSQNEVVLDSCESFTPTITLPLVMFIRGRGKDVNQHENPRFNYYLWNALHVKKPYVNSFYPFSWINEIENNSEKIISHILNIMNPEDVLRSNLEVIFQGILDDIYKRSDFDMGFVMAQSFPELTVSEYAFIDNGVPYDFETSKDFIEFIKSNSKLNNIIKIVTLKLNGNILFVSGNFGIEFSQQGIISMELSEEFFEGNLVSFIF